MSHEMHESHRGNGSPAWQSDGLMPSKAMLGFAALTVAAVGFWMIRRSRRRTLAERARDTAGEVAQETLDRARDLYEHRDELTEDALRMAADASKIAQRALQFVQQARNGAAEAYEHRDELLDDVADMSKDLQGRYRRMRGRMGL